MSSNHFNTLPGHEKSTLRTFFLGKRKFLLEKKPDKKRALDLEIQSRLLMSDLYRDTDTVLCYVSRDFEIDTRGILLAAFSNHKRVAVPRYEENGEIRFYLISSLSNLEEGAFGVREPKRQMRAVENFEGSICVCPALCCDMRGYRVGFGKGCYDRFLRDYPGVSISLCYSDALIPEIVTDDSDIHTNAVVTDSFLRHID